MKYQVSGWNRSYTHTHSSVMPVMCCLSLLLSGLKFSNGAIVICSSRLSTLHTQWVSGIVGYMTWFTYLNFGLCAVRPRLSLTTCYSFVLSMIDSPLLIESEWKALPWWLHLLALHFFRGPCSVKSHKPAFFKSLSIWRPYSKRKSSIIGVY